MGDRSQKCEQYALKLEVEGNEKVPVKKKPRRCPFLCVGSVWAILGPLEHPPDLLLILVLLETRL